MRNVTKLCIAIYGSPPQSFWRVFFPVHTHRFTFVILVYRVKHVFPNVYHLSVVAMLFPRSGKENWQYQKIEDPGSQFCRRVSRQRRRGRLISRYFAKPLNLICCADKKVTNLAKFFLIILALIFVLFLSFCADT